MPLLAIDIQRKILSFIRRLFLSFLLVTCLAACSNDLELHSSLDAEQSVEVLVALGRAGVEARRERVSTGRTELYSVLVSRSNYQNALEILHEFGLPSSRAESVEGLLSPSGFFPGSPEMSGLRVDHVVALELERLLEELPGIHSAKVIVRSKSNRRNSRRLLNSNQEPTTASVVIRYSSSSRTELPFSLEDVRQIILKSIPSIEEKDISLTTSKVSIGSNQMGSILAGQLRKVSPFAFRVPQQDYLNAKYQLVGILLLICFAGILLGWATGSILTRRRIIKRFNSANFNDGSLFIENARGPVSREKDNLLTDGREDA